MNLFKSQFDKMIETHSKIVENGKIEQTSKMVRNMINIHQLKELNEKTQMNFIKEIYDNENEYKNECKNKSLISKIICLHHLFINTSLNGNGIKSEIDFVLEKLEEPIIIYEHIQKLYSKNILKQFFEELIENYDDYSIELESQSESFDSIMNIINDIKKQYPTIAQKISIYYNLFETTSENSNTSSDNDNYLCTFKTKYCETNENELSKMFDLFKTKLNEGKLEFQYCCMISKISIPSSITSIKNSSFSYCESLTQITIPTSVTSIENYAFRQCNKLKEIILPSTINKIGEKAFYQCSSLAKITIPPFLTKIENGVFYECSSLKQITIPSSVKTIGEEAFYRCSSLENISIESSSLSVISRSAFYGCSKLREMTIPSSVTEIGYSSFEGCSSLVQIIIPSSVTVIKGSTFSSCRSLQQISIPPSVTSIEVDAFRGCMSLAKITIPSSVKSIKERAFADCKSLKNVLIPSSITSIEKETFRGCSSLIKLSIPSVNSIYRSAFYECPRILINSIPSHLFKDSY